MLCYITNVMLYSIKYVMLCYDIQIAFHFNVTLCYITCVMLLYNKCHAYITSVMLCYIT